MLGAPGKSTYASVKEYTGFTVLPYDQKTVAANGTTLVEIRYARNIHPLIWETNGGNPLTGEYTHGNVMYGTPIILPDQPRLKDHRFLGWYRDEERKVPLEANATMPDGPLTLYAKWEEYSANYIVNHYKQKLGGGYELAETETDSDTIGFETSAAAKDYEGFTAQPFEQVIIEKDSPNVVNIYYNRNSYELTFDYDFGNVVTTSVLYEADIVKPADPTHEEYTFMGWDSTIPDTMPADNLTFRALWGYSYQVVHIREDLDGTYQADGELAESEQKVDFPGALTSAQAKTFNGFTAQPFEQQTLTDGSIVIEIRYARNVHSLTWEANGGDPLAGQYTQGDIKYGTPLVFPDKPTFANHVFIGWFKDAGLTVPFEETAMPDEPLTLYAKWAELGEIWVNNVQITPENVHDVLGDGGTVSLDASTNTLILNNAHLTNATTRGSNTVIIYSYTSEDLTLRLIGDNSIMDANSEANHYGIYTINKLIIEGPGTLTVRSGTAIRVDRLTVNGGTLDLSGEINGIYVYALLGTGMTVNDGTLTIRGGSSAMGYGGASIFNSISENKTVLVGDEAPGSPAESSLILTNYKYIRIE
jgi:uncharacterized repeat protein (TIGR02543 family)